MRDQLIFPEVDYNKISQAMGMNVTICTTAKTDPEAKALFDATFEGFGGYDRRTAGTRNPPEAP